MSESNLFEQAEQFNISANELKQKIDRNDDFCLLDVRLGDEHAYVKLPGSTLIPIHELQERLYELDPDKETVVYCRTGVRSMQAAWLLHRVGFRRVWNLKGGLHAWSADVDPSVPQY